MRLYVFRLYDVLMAEKVARQSGPETKDVIFRRISESSLAARSWSNSSSPESSQEPEHSGHLSFTVLRGPLGDPWTRGICTEGRSWTPAELRPLGIQFSLRKERLLRLASPEHDGTTLSVDTMEPRRKESG